MSTENLENAKKKGIELECQTDLTGQHILEMQQCINTMTCELAELKKKLLETDLTEDNLKDNDEKTALYTGLPIFLVFIQVLKLCDAFVLPTATNSLTKFQELLLVLMRLRLNIPFQDLAYRFGISRSTACRIFDKWIEVLSVRLNFLIMWPTRENLIKTMPAVLRVVQYCRIYSIGTIREFRAAIMGDANGLIRRIRTRMERFVESIHRTRMVRLVNKSEYVHKAKVGCKYSSNR